MATLTITATESGQPTLSKTFTMADATMDLMIQAYQSDANVSVNGTATRAQVMLYITGVWQQGIKDKIQQFQTQPAVVPSQVTIS